MTVQVRNDGPLLVRSEGATVVVTLNRPERLNALDAPTLHAIVEVMAEIATDARVRAVVITGATVRAFCAGADIRWLGTAASATDVADRARVGHAAMDAVSACTRPVIAAVEGVAFGGGCELSLACDFRIVGAGARFSQPEIKLGVLPGWGGTQRLPRIVGTARALDMILTGRIVGADEALQFGLASSVVPDGTALDGALQLAQRFAASPPVALGLAKRVVWEAVDLPLTLGLTHEIGAFVEAFATEDATEGVAAFLGKREPQFSGR